MPKLQKPKNRLYIDADRIKFAMVLQNLIQNSIKYVPDDRAPMIRIEMSSKIKQSNHGAYLITISIIDNGYGIKAEHFERIFEPTFRIKHAKEEPGTGIGLSIVKDVVERHNGIIKVDSDGEFGTEMRLELPQRRIQA